MSTIPVEIWYKIAGYIECPNPVLFTRLAAVSFTAHTVFTSDQVWGKISPRSISQAYFEHFIGRVAEISNDYKALLRQCWAAVDEFTSPTSGSRVEHTLKLRADALFMRDLLADYIAVPEILLPIVVWYAINADTDRSIVATAPLLENREFVQVAVQIDGRCLNLAPRFCDDDEIVFTAVSSHGQVLEHVSDRLCRKEEIVLAAVSNYGSSIRFMGSNLISDRTVALTAVQNHGWALQRVSEWFLEDREIVLSAILNYCAVLQFASTKLRSDKALVTTAVTQQGWTLRYAVPELQDDIGVVEAATKQDPSAIRYASENLRDNKALMMSVLARDSSLLSFASERLQADPEILAIVRAKTEPYIVPAQDKFTQWITEDWTRPALA